MSLILIFALSLTQAQALSKSDSAMWTQKIASACEAAMKRNQTAGDRKSICACIARNHVVQAQLDTKGKQTTAQLAFVEAIYLETDTSQLARQVKQPSQLQDFDIDLATACIANPSHRLPK